MDFSAQVSKRSDWSVIELIGSSTQHLDGRHVRLQAEWQVCSLQEV